MKANNFCHVSFTSSSSPEAELIFAGRLLLQDPGPPWLWPQRVQPRSLWGHSSFATTGSTSEWQTAEREQDCLSLGGSTDLRVGAAFLEVKRVVPSLRVALRGSRVKLFPRRRLALFKRSTEVTDWFQISSNQIRGAPVSFVSERRAPAWTQLCILKTDSENSPSDSICVHKVLGRTLEIPTSSREILERSESL